MIRLSGPEVQRLSRRSATVSPACWRRRNTYPHGDVDNPLHRTSGHDLPSRWELHPHQPCAHNMPIPRRMTLHRLHRETTTKGSSQQSTNRPAETGSTCQSTITLWQCYCPATGHTRPCQLFDNIQQADPAKGDDQNEGGRSHGTRRSKPPCTVP